MKESYRCKCDNDSWLVFGYKIQCTKCGRIYRLFSEVVEFNNDIEKSKENELEYMR